MLRLRSAVSVRHSSSLALYSDQRDLIYKRKFEDLLLSLNLGAASHSRVWSYYISLVNYLGYHHLPLKIHQNVLRKCTPTSTFLRDAVTQRLMLGRPPRRPHLYEGRLQTVIRNIRAMDIVPALEDYNFILEQFAAVGHHFGALQVYKEMLRVGLSPNSQTYGLCLQAIAHRLALPGERTERRIHAINCRKMLQILLNDMQKQGKQFTSVNLDLTIRILKDTFDLKGFESVMCWGYGIDLSNPDCAPLHLTENHAIASSLSMSPDSLPQVSKPLYFSTSALNTTIDVLGRMGQISKMVQTFEVLTNAMPGAHQHRSSSAFDDDEDDFGVSVQTQPPAFTPPTASPNITTYNMLLRHICKADNAVLARHYLMEAYHLERETHRKTVIELYSEPLSRVRSPHFMINRGTLVPLLGQTNKDKNIGLMRWTSRLVQFLLESKRRHLAFFTQFRDGMIKRGDFSSQSVIATQVLAASPTQTSKKTKIFDLDLEDSSIPLPPPVKYLDLNLHIQISDRNITEIELFHQHLKDVLARSIQRVKERLTRRVWDGKSIYFQTRRRRALTSRPDWHNFVNFRPRRSNPLPRNNLRTFRRDWTCSTLPRAS